MVNQFQVKTAKVLICFLLPTWAWIKNFPEQLPKLNQSDMGVLTSGSICGISWEKTSTTCNNGVFFFCFPVKFINKEEYSLRHNFFTLCISSLFFYIDYFILFLYLPQPFIIINLFSPHHFTFYHSYPTNQIWWEWKKEWFIASSDSIN